MGNGKKLTAKELEQLWAAENAVKKVTKDTPASKVLKDTSTKLNDR